jgi:hypothetical protein
MKSSRRSFLRLVGLAPVAVSMPVAAAPAGPPAPPALPKRSGPRFETVRVENPEDPRQFIEFNRFVRE